MTTGDGASYRAVITAISGSGESRSASDERKVSVPFDEKSKGTLATFAVDLAGAFIGHCGYFPEQTLGWELMVFLHPDHWRKGYGEEIGRRLLDVGHAAIGVERLYGLPMHPKAEELCRRLGMVRLGRRKVKTRPVYYADASSDSL